MKSHWQKIKEKEVFDSQFGHKVRFDEVVSPVGKEMHYFVLDIKPHSIVVALTSDNKVLVEKQYRYPIEREIFELPVGGIEEGETPLEAAKRELKEETGAESDNWVELGWHWVDSGFSNLKGHVFLARDIKLGTPTSDDENEEIENELWSWDTLVKKVKSGEITDLRSKIAVLLAKEYLEK